MSKVYAKINEKRSYHRAIFLTVSLATAALCSLSPVACFKNFSSKERRKREHEAHLKEDAANQVAWEIEQEEAREAMEAEMEEEEEERRQARVRRRSHSQPRISRMPHEHRHSSTRIPERRGSRHTRVREEVVELRQRPGRPSYDQESDHERRHHSRARRHSRQ